MFGSTRLFVSWEPFAFYFIWKIQVEGIIIRRVLETLNSLKIKSHISPLLWLSVGGEHLCR